MSLSTTNCPHWLRILLLLPVPPLHARRCSAWFTSHPSPPGIGTCHATSIYRFCGDCTTTWLKGAHGGWVLHFHHGTFFVGKLLATIDFSASCLLTGSSFTPPRIFLLVRASSSSRPYLSAAPSFRATGAATRLLRQHLLHPAHTPAYRDKKKKKNARLSRLCSAVHCTAAVYRCRFSARLRATRALYALRALNVRATPLLLNTFA